MAARVEAKYEADSGEIHIMRLTPQVVAAIGTQPTGDPTSSIKVKVSKGNSEFGLRPRGVRISRVFGTAPDTFRKYAFIPVALASAYGTAPFVQGGTVTYNGQDWTVASLQPEDY